MERAALLRSLSCSSLACNRFYFRSSFNKLAKASFSRRLSSSAPFSAVSARRNNHRLIGNLTARSLLRRHDRLQLSLSSCSRQFNKHFSSVSPCAVASPPTQPSPGANSSYVFFLLLSFACVFSILVLKLLFYLFGVCFYLLSFYKFI